MQPDAMDTMNTMESMTGMSAGRPKRKTHRGRRGRGKGSTASNPHHDQAKSHMADAIDCASPHEAHGHLFKALTAINRAKRAAADA